jgi:hypothetical protein
MKQYNLLPWQNRAIVLTKEPRENWTWDSLAEILTGEFQEPFTGNQVRKFIGRWDSQQKQKGVIQYEDRKPEPSIELVDDYYNALRNLDSIVSQLDTKQTKLHVTLKDTKPIGIAFWGDWHLGARGIDYDGFEQDKNDILNTPGLYFIGTGDYKDNNNAFVHAASTFESLAQPGLQDLLVKKVMLEMKDKAIALVRGCHDDWDKKLGDKDFISTLCSSDVADCVNLWHGGSVVINFQGAEYKIRARHKFKGESDLNSTNTQRRMVDMFGHADVNATAHKHFPDLHQSNRFGQECIYLRSGSYKVYDEFGQKLAGYFAIRGVPMVILWPGTKRIMGFKFLRDGIDYLTSLRREAA